MHPINRAEYQAVPSSPSDAHPPDIELGPVSKGEKVRPDICSRFFWTWQILFFCTSMAIFLASSTAKYAESVCTRQLSSWSPILEVPGLVKYESVNFQLDSVEPLSYRGPPTPERERLWEDLWHVHGISVPHEKLKLMNRTDNNKKYKKVITDHGWGYGAQVETFHQLHCLSMLRQWSYREHFDDRETFPSGLPEGLSGDREVALMHLDHCIEVIRLNLMCTADVTPYLFEEDPSGKRDEMVPDYESNHKCRNFWGIKNWVEHHAIAM